MDRNTKVLMDAYNILNGRVRELEQAVATLREEMSDLKEVHRHLLASHAPEPPIESSD